MTQRPTVRFVLPGLVLATTLSLAACSDAEPSPAERSAPPSTASSPAAEATDKFVAADVMFARGMIPHHEQAVEMSDVVLAKDDLDPQVAELAEQIKAAQAPEIAQLTDWLRAWGENPSVEPEGGHGGEHGGHDMSGMMSEADLADLASADGPEASRLFLTQMIEHHEGAVQMAQAELDDGEHPGAREMARTIVDTQSDEIAQMREMLAGD